ncbi:putative rhomboid protein [Talaromyces atroroseus]|uniref:Rhomboid-type serine protease n=1 Tax=Talaromyces atroroseus TaxID=1441469 RepID=A0A225A9F6_TALAT|nr:putative rhomboid protein [Talaromyces atroroseus]OKL57501.1 putative rhomboid protein [Talaromyces atroroseus]
MTANDYYNGFRPQTTHSQPPSYHDSDYYHQAPENSPQLHPFSSAAQQSPYSPQYEDYSHQPQYSQNSLADDNGFVGGRNHPADQYGEDIPLKPNAQAAQARDSRWVNENTHYDAGMPMDPVMGSRRKRRRPKKQGYFGTKIPWVTWLLTAVDIGVFIGELIYSGRLIAVPTALECIRLIGFSEAQLTGSPIEIHPSFNPMVGPSAYVQINMGSRFVSCMKNIPGVQDANTTINWPCPNTTTSDSSASSNHCTLSELCGFGGVPNPKPHGSLSDQPEPDQWFRFIIPMFLHAGIIHIGFNMLMQMTVGAEMERMIGWWRYALVYFASGIFGFVMGGNYAAQGISSTGASGSLFGLVALNLLDLLYTWRERRSPWVDLIFLVIEIAVSFVLGLLPGLDNFSHIGGFIMGLAMGLCMMRSPNYIRERIGLQRRPYVVMSGGAGPSPEDNGNQDGINNVNNTLDDNSKPRRSKSARRVLNFFQGRKPLWWAWWLVRAGALVAVIIGFILLLTDFYKYPKSNCSWCYRLSCLPIKNWCSVGNLDLTETSS